MKTQEETPRIENVLENQPISEGAIILKSKEEERIRIITVLLENRETMIAEYQHLIKHSGGLVTRSMGVAYARAINDVFKLITKGNK